MCIVGAILAVAFACCVVCGFKSLKMAIDVIDASADYLASAKRVILVPVLYFFLTIILLVIVLDYYYAEARLRNMKGGLGKSKIIKWG